MPNELRPLTAEDLAALGFLYISREREDDMGACWARDMRPGGTYGCVSLVAKASLFESLTYPNTRGSLTPQWQERAVAPHDTAQLAEGDTLLIWHAAMIPAELMAKLFNHDQVPAYLKATEWEQAARAAGVVGMETATPAAIPGSPVYVHGDPTPYTIPIPDGTHSFAFPAPAAPRVKVGDRVLVQLDPDNATNLDCCVVEQVSPLGNLRILPDTENDSGSVWIGVPCWVRPAAVVEVLP